jgi:hypothetical protein|tara:strand:+ start:439 stop:567 length:129 start_codon:yes stop_codon:yes gene_type:complete
MLGEKNERATGIKVVVWSFFKTRVVLNTNEISDISLSDSNNF